MLLVVVFARAKKHKENIPKILLPTDLCKRFCGKILINKIDKMENILKEFINNNEANGAYVTAKVTYISLEDVDTLLKRQKEQLHLHVVGCSKTSEDNQYKLAEISNALRLVKNYRSELNLPETCLDRQVEIAKQFVDDAII